MRAMLLGLVMSAALALPVAADDKSDITGVIQRQIDAFLAEDVATAFSFASPGIKRLFGTPDRFGSMVREGYPMVWRPADVRYLDLKTEGGFPVQQVLITDEAGATHVLEYQMLQTESGWQIGGVRILRAPGVGA